MLVEQTVCFDGFGHQVNQSCVSGRQNLGSFGGRPTVEG